MGYKAEHLSHDSCGYKAEHLKVLIHRDIRQNI